MLSGRSDASGGEGGARRAAAPATAKKAAEPGKPGGDESFDDFPGAIDEEDDDLPF
jgi:single-stranded DNA-binding protein